MKLDTQLLKNIIKKKTVDNLHIISITLFLILYVVYLNATQPTFPNENILNGSVEIVTFDQYNFSFVVFGTNNDKYTTHLLSQLHKFYPNNKIKFVNVETDPKCFKQISDFLESPYVPMTIIFYNNSPIVIITGDYSTVDQTTINYLNNDLYYKYHGYSEKYNTTKIIVCFTNREFVLTGEQYDRIINILRSCGYM